MGAWPGAGGVAGIEAGVGPDGDECLEFADDGVEGQAWRGGFLGHPVRFKPCRQVTRRSSAIPAAPVSPGSDTRGRAQILPVCIATATTRSRPPTVPAPVVSRDQWRSCLEAGNALPRPLEHSLAEMTAIGFPARRHSTRWPAGSGRLTRSGLGPLPSMRLWRVRMGHEQADESAPSR